MKKALTLSIIIPTYNEADHIGDCLKSISNQTIMPEEVIVVDNNCIDDSIQIAHKYSFVRVVKESKQGIVYARNKGFNEAKSDILGRIDADSILPTNWVETVKNFYESKVHFIANAWTSDGYSYNVQHAKHYSWFFAQVVYRCNNLLLGHFPLWGSSMAITKKQWNDVKQEICLRNDIHEDLDLSIHLHRSGIKITYDTSLKTGVFLRRVFDDFSSLWPNLMLWPNTLKYHNSKKWFYSYLGAIFIFLIAPIFRLEKKLFFNSDK